jgi:hypothetical protein
MLHPRKWDSAARDRNIQAILEGLYVQTRSRGPTFMGLPSDISFQDFLSQVQQVDTMALNPIFDEANIMGDSN